ncbi:hypothetical protein N8T08_010648 [Aspergillus melleus]|uniref:Uncharacterized protein n=1 Tax=Aspergillus melleus TaxID=138277 RepID=A0ACC3ARA6_9EURO|nr:hypothetical protein N8T08_010648 [Aspergillus melleus]
MRDMDTVSVASDRASARVGGGVIAGHLQETPNSHGLFTPTGQAKSVGYVSWAYSELLWALRGAGAGTFGIVMELRVKVYPAPKLYAGFLAFPLAKAATVMDKIERLLEDDFPDEFSGDAIATSLSEDLGPAKSFLEQTMQVGRVLGNTVTETTPAAYGLGDSSSGTFFRSRNVDQIQQNVGTILARHPPPHPLSAVIFHNNHGKGVLRQVTDTVGAAFPNRYKHVILGLYGVTRPGWVDEKELASAAKWVIELEEEADQNSLSLRGGFPAFWPPDQVNIERFFGEEKALRLRQLKARLDPKDPFHQALPGLSGFLMEPDITLSCRSSAVMRSDGWFSHAPRLP